MKLHPNIKSYFIKINPELTTDILVDNNTIFIKGNESFIPGCLIKTLESINYLLKMKILILSLEQICRVLLI
jgi:hypothetical protein